MSMKRGTRTDLWVVVVIALLGSLCACRPRTPDVIRVGGIFDLTGATSEIGIPYADGIRDCVQYINEQGGINGRQIELVDEDYGYNIERAKTVYTRLVEEEKVLVIMSWGTGDTDAMRPLIAADRIPLMSASYSE